MRECSEYAELASSFVDGELEAALGEETEQHCNSCSQCGAWLADLRYIRSASHSALTPIQVSHEFRQKIHLEIHKTAGREQIIPRRTPTIRWGWSMAPVAMAACVLMVFFSWPREIPLAALPPSYAVESGTDGFNSVEAAAKHINSELGLVCYPVTLEQLGLTFRHAGNVKCGSWRGAYLEFEGAQGQIVKVYQMEANTANHLPKAKSLVCQGCPAKVIKRADGESELFWPQKDIVVVICANTNQLETMKVQKVVSAQLDKAAKSL